MINISEPLKGTVSVISSEPPTPCQDGNIRFTAVPKTFI